MDPTPERFRRLARSAPYRWRTLLLEGSWGLRVGRVRLELQRPDLVRVTDLHGRVLEHGRHGSLGSGATLTSDGRHLPYVPPQPPAPELDEDGLVVTERRPWDEGPEVPYWENYHVVATLDPYELSHGVDVLDLAAVEHGGRPAWEALLRPTSEYEPRCACCPLMRTRDTDLMEGLDPLPEYAEAFRVRLDVGTGVCVSAVEVGGASVGRELDIVVLRAEP